MRTCLISCEPRLASLFFSYYYAHLVFIAIHPGQCTNVTKDVLKGVGKLKCINVSKTELDVSVDNKLGQAENFTTQMEGISKAGFLALFGGQRPRFKGYNWKS